MVKVVVLDHQLANDSPAARALLPLFLPLLVLFVLLRYFGSRGARSKLPSSPPALPLIGHAHLIGALPHVSLRDLAARHGGRDGLMMLRLGTVPTLVASSARAAQAVLRTHDQAFASRVRSVFGDVLSYGPSDVVFAPYGEGWRQAKKLVTTHLLNTKKVQSYRAAREEEVAMVIDKIRRAAMAREVVDMSELLSSFTNDMVCRAVAGRSFRVDGLDKEFKELLDESMALLGGFNLENLYPGLAKVAGGVLMWPGRRKAERLRDRWDEVLDKVIDEHASIPVGASAPARHDNDFTDVLLSMKEEHGLTRDGIKAILAVSLQLPFVTFQSLLLTIRLASNRSSSISISSVLDMFAAGTDTAYLVLEYTMAELMRHQHVMAKLQAEVRSCIPKGQEAITEDNLTKMSYLKAVIKETLRLHPPSPLLIPHLSVEDCNIDSYMVPAGTTVFVNVWAIGRDPSLWDAVEEFMPERFISKGVTEGVDFRGTDFQFLPFGSGRRMCPGMNFAVASMELMLANLVYHFDWEMPRGMNDIDMTEAFGLTLHRKDKLILTPRLPCVAEEPLEG
ncbi:indolin-2-one monooxygenase [Dichanthelium oligosanthes]|uniref:Indolin-2-one monooxygenase n=1 Tax=Dichanthelium oligosanthes TaxID=888268 RepID=A0A1E5VHP9_9POAL|nr:indolin-2-one monooxygenase [Dichanthelium oligosanthes]